MTVNVEFFLAGSPCLFLRREAGVKGLDGGGVLTAVGGMRGDIHPPMTVQRTGDQLADQKRRRKVAGNDKADVFLFAADESAADVVTGIAEVDVYGKGTSKTPCRRPLCHCG